MSSVTLTLQRHGPVRGTYAGAGFKPQIWLFAVYDRNTRDCMLSCEKDSQLYMARMDLFRELKQAENAAFKAMDWSLVGTTTGTPSDHWHIFAHGRHYLSFNDTATTGTELYVLRVERDLSDVSSPVELCLISVYEQSGTPGTCLTGWNVPSAPVLLTNCLVSLNDHFMVVAATGVYVVVADQKNNELLVCQTDNGLTTGSQVGTYGFTDLQPDGSEYAIQAGGSGGRGGASGGVRNYDFVTQTSFDTTSTADSDLYYGVRDDTFSPPASPTWEISEEDDYGNDLFLMFPTRIKLTNGWSIVTYIRYDTTSGYDGGDVVRQLFDASDAESGDVEVLMTASATRGAARPHVTLVGNFLITTWDEVVPAGLRCYMWVDLLALT